jgi:hypothetical protein
MDDRHDFGASGPFDVPAGPAGPEDTAFAGLTALLWREREVLDLLLFKLTAQQLILRAGELRWLAAADREVASALQRLREFDVLRALEAHDLVRSLGVPEETSLRELAESAPEPWAGLLLDHRQALRELAAQIAATTETNRRLLRAGADAAGETLTQVAGATATYGATGAPVAAPSGPFLLDRQA